MSFAEIRGKECTGGGGGGGDGRGRHGEWRGEDGRDGRGW